MTHADALAIHVGDPVWYDRRLYRVATVRTTGVHAPYFQLAGIGFVSYQFCVRPVWWQAVAEAVAADALQ